MYKTECFYDVERKPRKEKDDGKGKKPGESSSRIALTISGALSVLINCTFIYNLE